MVDFQEYCTGAGGLTWFRGHLLNMFVFEVFLQGHFLFLDWMEMGFLIPCPLLKKQQIVNYIGYTEMPCWKEMMHLCFKKNAFSFCLPSSYIQKISGIARQCQ